MLKKIKLRRLSYVKKNLNSNCNIEYLLPELDEDKNFLKKFRVSEILEDKYTLINQTYTCPIDELWNNKEISNLWEYNLYYLDFLLPLLYEYKISNDQKYFLKIKEILLSWYDKSQKKDNVSWDAYTISMRLPNLIIAHQTILKTAENSKELLQLLRQSIYQQYMYLKKNQEKHLLGNHYLENIKAIILGSLFFSESRVTNKYVKVLQNELQEQVLSDGMHFERSPMYNKIVFELLIKTIYWLKQAEFDSTQILKLTNTCQNILNSIYSLEKNMGKTPFFNDSADGISKNYDSLIRASCKYLGIKPKKINRLTSSGYEVMEKGLLKMVIDYGEIGPKYLPGHGHCDALSYELSISGLPIIVNSGTFEYEKGYWRDFFRRTSAQNTVQFGSVEQSEIWSSFRVARRSYDHKGLNFNLGKYNFFVGSYFNYRGDKHRRFITFLDEEIILFLDEISTKDNRLAKSYLHFHPNLKTENNIIRSKDNEKIVLKIHPLFSKNRGNGKAGSNEGYYSSHFNIKKPISTYELTADIGDTFIGYILNFGDKDVSYNILNDYLEISIGEEKAIINLAKLFSLKF